MLTHRPQQPTFVLLCSLTQFRKLEPHQVLVSHQDVFLGERKKGTVQLMLGYSLLFVPSWLCYHPALDRFPRTVARVDDLA